MALDLQPGLMGQSILGVCLNAWDLGFQRQLGQRLHRRNTRSAQARHLDTGDAGNPVEVVIPFPLFATKVSPTAHGTTVRAFRVALSVGASRPRQETVFKLPVVTKVVGNEERLLATIAEHHVHMAWHDPLHISQHFRVQAQLEQELGATRARQLGILHLVAEVPELGRSFYADQKVGVADPWGTQECCLEQDLGPTLQRLPGVGEGNLV